MTSDMSESPPVPEELSESIPRQFKGIPATLIFYPPPNVGDSEPNVTVSETEIGSVVTTKSQSKTSYLLEDESSTMSMPITSGEVTYYPHNQRSNKPLGFKPPAYLKELTPEAVTENAIIIQAGWKEFYLLTEGDRWADALHDLGYYHDTRLLPVSEGEAWSVFGDSSLAPDEPDNKKPHVKKLHSENLMAEKPDTVAASMTVRWDPAAADKIVRGSLGFSIGFLNKSEAVDLKNEIRGPFAPHETILSYDLTSATVTPLLALSEGPSSIDEAAKKRLSQQLVKFLKALDESKKSVKVIFSAPGPDGKVVRLSQWKGDNISIALAYAIVIGLKGGNWAFATVITRAPPNAQMQAARLAEGRLINEESAAQILHTVIQWLIDDPKSVRGSEVALADASANFVAVLYRDMALGEGTTLSEADNGVCEALMLILRELVQRDISRTPKGIQKIALNMGLVVAGMLKYVIDLKKQDDDAHRRATVALTAGISAIGFAVPVPYVAAAGGVACVVGSAILDYFWGSPFEGLESAIRDSLLTNIYWPLHTSRALELVGMEDLSKDETTTFTTFFELALKSAHVL